LAASRSVGASGRKLATQPEAAFAIGFASAAPVEALLKSRRFIAAGAFGQSGKRYQLTSKQLQSSAGQDLLLKELAELELGAGKEALAWFPRQKLLCFGSEPYLADVAQVLENGAAAVSGSPAFQGAHKDFDPNARVTLFVDPAVFSNVDDLKLKEFVDGYFKPAGPVTGSLVVKPAGFLTRLAGHVIGSKLPKGSSYVAPSKLVLANRLPIETFAYAAFQTQAKLSGAEIEKLLMDQLDAAKPGSRSEAEQALRHFEQSLGIHVATLIDGLGGEGVLAFSAPSDFVPDAGLLSRGPEAASNLDVTWVQELKSDAEYKRLAAQLKTKLLPAVREVTITEDGPGFALTPRGSSAPLSLRVKFFDKHLFITAGGSSLCDRAEGAFAKNDRTLKDDAAHQSALAALPDAAHARIWLDTGRIADTLFKNPLLRARATESGMQLDKFRLTGPQRVTSALSLRTAVENEVWTYQIDALNLQALAPLGLGAMSLRGLSTRRPLQPL
jgi:hypothetical protein